MHRLTATATTEHAPERLDRVALALFAALASGSQVRKLARKGHVLVDGQPVEPMTSVFPGQTLSISLPEDHGPVLELDLDVLYEDDDLAVVWKPAGLVTSGHRPRTLKAALSHALSSSPLQDALSRPHPVHRLDARTRGLVVCAKTFHADVALSAAFAERRVQKRYRALLRGRLDGEGVVDQPVDDRPARSRWRSVDVVPAPITEWLTVVDLWPETGRKHQLRQHCAALGHPILGDGRYTDDGPVLRGQGMMLAAVALTLPHPRDGRELTVDTGMPDKLATFVARARRRSQRE